MSEIVEHPASKARAEKAAAKAINEARRALKPPDPVERLAAVIVEVQADQDALRAELRELRSALKAEPSFAPAGYETIKRLAERTGRMVECIPLWACSGAIPAVRRNGVWYADRAVTEEYARSR
jgi:hypothetical protein